MFREVKDVVKNEVKPKEPEKIEFELKEEESDSTVEEESVQILNNMTLIHRDYPDYTLFVECMHNT